MSSQFFTEVKLNSLHNFLRGGIYLLLLLMPFHAPITVWLASLGFDYDLVRLWKEALLFVLAIVALLIVYRSKKFSEWFAGNMVVKLTLVFVALAAVSAVVVLLTNSVSPRAVGFGLIVDTRMLLMMLVVMVAIHSKILLPIPRWVVLPAIGVIGFGLMQMAFLPADFLNHFGYGPDTIKAYQAVDNNMDFVRVQSTLRGPNPLGAYLIPVTALLIVGAQRYKRYKWQFVTAALAAGLVMLGTYSRSAWIGLAVTLGLLAGWQVRNKLKRPVLIIAAVIVAVGTLGIYVLRDNDAVQNIVFHSSEKSPSAQSSNNARFSALSDGASDVITEPLGGGIGSAGPASAHNAFRSRQSENFYIQIGRELGILGLALYLAITISILHRLWPQRNNRVIQAILASFIGLIVVNMLSHAWSDDTLAYVFGAVLGYGLTAHSKPNTK